MEVDKEEVTLIDLTVNTSLINANFDGYKLNLDRLAVKEIPLPIGVPDLQPSGSQFSFEQAKIFAHAGQLYFDTWNSSDSSSIFILPQKDGNFYRIEYNIETRQWGEIMPITGNGTPGPQALPPSAVFPTKELAVVSNGSNQVTIFKTAEKRMSWEEAFTFSPFESSGIYLQDARLVNGSLEILVESVVDHEKTSPEDHQVFDLIVAWVSVSTEPWSVTRKQDISLPGHVNFITLDERAENLIVNSSESPRVLADTDGLIGSAEPEKMEAEMEGEKKQYVWTERGDEVAIAFNLDSGVKKHDVTVKPAANSIYVSVGGNVVLNGRLGGHIQPDSATWTLGDPNKLEVTLFKRDTGVRWSFLVEGDQRGRYELDPLQLDEATAALEKFSCDFKVPGGLGASENFNSEQTEECDMTEDTMSTIFWYSRQKQAIEQRCDITGHQFLYEKKVSGEPSRVCIRYDVEGMLFSFCEGNLVNDDCFAAFGYIQASKTNRRWCVNAPNNSYIALAEANNHAFVYHQSTTVASELLNRKTKQMVPAVAKQQVISLKSRENAMDLDEAKSYNILAAHAENKALFLLTPDTIYAVCIE